MSANSKIEWTDHTFNPWIGCTKVSPACDHCYAERSTPSRTLGVAWGAGQERHRTSESNWELPGRWNAQADAFMATHGRRQRVFCASLADVFDNEVDPAWRIDLFKLIRRTPNLDWLLLTKRIGNVPKLTVDALPPNCWLGATICNQAEADRDIPKLLAVPARVRFLSMEPLLGPVDLSLPTRTWETGRGPFGTSPPAIICDHCCNGDRCDDPTHFDRGRPDYAPHCRCPYCRGTGRGRPIDWVIVGGESGPQARPMHPDWARSLRDQCQAAGVPFHFKQWGEWMPYDYLDDEARISTSDKPWQRENGSDFERGLVRVGKKAAGRMLDGRTWDEVPA